MHEGYAEAGITDIVAVAGASVGSLYHHFSGKADLYLALFEELSNEHDIRTRKAVRECRDSGVTDPMRLLAGARGYLDVCVEQRDLASMFARGDGPPGFEVLWRKRLSDWVHRNTEFFARSGEPLDEAAAIVMTGAMMLAVAEISLARGTRPEPSSSPMACSKPHRPDCASRQPRNTGRARRCVQSGAALCSEGRARRLLRSVGLVLVMVRERGCEPGPCSLKPFLADSSQRFTPLPELK